MEPGGGGGAVWRGVLVLRVRWGVRTERTRARWAGRILAVVSGLVPFGVCGVG